MPSGARRRPSDTTGRKEHAHLEVRLRFKRVVFAGGKVLAAGGLISDEQIGKDSIAEYLD